MSEYKILLVDDEEELVTAMVERLEVRGIIESVVNEGLGTYLEEHPQDARRLSEDRKSVV